MLNMIKKQLLTLNKQQPTRNILRGIFVWIFLAVGIFGFAQVQKLDARFELLLKNKNIVEKGQKIDRLQIEGMQLAEHSVVTAKGLQTMYSAIIYTNDTEKLKSLGILVQSKLPKFVTALVTIEDLEFLRNEPSVISIQSPQIDRAENDASRAEAGTNLLQSGVINGTPYNGQGVLTAVIDSGIDWTHPEFKRTDDPSKSRVFRIWDQTLAATTAGNPPAGFSYGREYTREDIEDELDGTPANYVLTTDTFGHGSHVAGTLAGSGGNYEDKRYRGFAAESDLIIVKAGVSGFPVSNVVDGLNYLKNLATTLNKPIVVNLSLGGHFYAHDGSAPHEIAIDDFTTSAPGRVVTVAAGNDYGANIHRKIELAPTESKTLEIEVEVDNNSKYGFYLYVTGNDDSEFTPVLKDPAGNEFPFPPTQNSEYVSTNGAFTYSGSNFWSPANGKRYFQFVVVRNQGFNTNMGGIYKIQLQNTTTKNLTYHAWVIQQNIPLTFKNGDNNYIIATPGNTPNAITVGSYFGNDSYYSNNAFYGSGFGPQFPTGGISQSSSAGPTVNEIIKPDINANGEFVISVKSAQSNAFSSTIVDGIYKRSIGTSMSAPAVAGAIALLLQANPNLTYTQVKEKLTQNARQDVMVGTVPNNRWGYGKLDIYKAVSSELNCTISETETIAYDKPFQAPYTDKHFTYNNTAIAVRYTPTKTGKLGAVRFNSYSDLPSDTPGAIEVRKVNADGNPGELLGNLPIASLRSSVHRAAENYFDLSGLNIQVSTNEDFYIVFNSLNGTTSFRAEQIEVDGRTKLSTDGTNWTAAEYDLRMRAIIYEDKPEIKNLATTTQSTNATMVEGKNYITNNCEFLARVEKSASHTISGNLSAKVWIDNATTYVGRRYELLPTDNPTTATAKVTLYFTQADFDAYNEDKTIKLPTSPTDEANKANIRIDKFAGSSVGNTGLPSSYTQGYVTITPNSNDIKWNATYNYWEVGFENTGFGGFMLRNTQDLATTDVSKNKMIIYPNPVKEILNFSFAKSVNDLHVKIYDISGKLVKSVQLNSSKQINLSTLAKGNYLVEVTADNGTIQFTKKLIKE